MIPRALTFLIIASGLAACVQVAPGADVQTLDQATSVGTLPPGTYPCHVKTPEQFSVLDNQTWSTVWEVCRSRVQTIVFSNGTGHAKESRPPLPDVDFSHSMVVGYAWGNQRASSSVDLDWNATTSTVVVTRVATSATCVTIAMTFPQGRLMVVPRTDLPVTFQFIDATGPPCE